ncbi:2OG-Fe(II) oxygenase [Variovorax sp. ZT4R33]|uniref:2OG-Fe(II) oxygenase n=1 Tax=Variovorax sp. ZT4R33 TaxID=3443743 RepID=UPI003F475654
MDRFRLIDDYLGDSQLDSIQGFFQSNVFWKFGWQSDRDKTPFGHWNHDFLKTPRTNQENCEHILLENSELFEIRDLWLRLKEEHLPGHALVRCYANAHTFGVEGYPHVDSRSPGNYTTIFYINPIWKPEWAGETVFLNDAGDIFQAVLPKPGRGVIFDGQVTHAARGLTRLCPAMRVTLMFKTRAPGSESDPQ